MLLPRFLHFASIAIAASRCSLRRVPFPAGRRPARFDRPPLMARCSMGSRFASRGIELSDGRRWRITAERVAV